MSDGQLPDTSNEGGTEWEQGLAVTRMTNAVRAGDIETMALAMGDYAAALGTRVTSNLSSIARPLFEELQGIRQDRATDARVIEHKIDMLIALAEDNQARLGKFEARLALLEANTLAAVISQTEREHLVDLARTIPELTRRIEAIEEAIETGRYGSPAEGG